MWITILIGLVVLSVLVLVHELGHFITAKAAGVRVEEFGLGLPPRIFGIRRGETLYSLNAIPFGGFNKLTGEEDPKKPRSLAGKSIGTRLLILSAGSLMNILLALLLLTFAFMIPHDVVTGEVVVQEVYSGSPAAMANIKEGDALLRVNDKPIRNTADLVRYVQLNLGKEITILVEHSDSTTEEVQVIPRWRPPEGQGAVGFLIYTAEPIAVRHYEPFWRAIPLAVKSCIEIFGLYKNGIISIIIGTAPATLVGPVGIVQITGEVAKAGISPLLELSALLTLVLGIINLFPIPALDGGRITFVLLEWIRRGKRISAKTEGRIHAIGFLLLITAMLAVTYQDIIRIISGESLIP